MDIKNFLIAPDKKIKLKDLSTRAPKDADKEAIKNGLIQENLDKMIEYQDKLYAENKQGLIVVFQAMDAAGKDGAIKHVMTALNPQGVLVTSFKAPSSYELDHDYLWRIHKAIPARGEIGIMNRSHYEDVIIAKVHDLLPAQNLPDRVLKGDVWEERYQQIKKFEEYYYENGFQFVKFFLHLSKEEQKKRLLDRINQSEKNWKFSPNDLHEREFWDDYQKAYEKMLNHTSTKNNPWYIVPADQKWFSRYVISEIVARHLEAMDPKIPELTKDEKQKLSQWRELLEKE